MTSYIFVLKVGLNKEIRTRIVINYVTTYLWVSLLSMNEVCTEEEGKDADSLEKMKDVLGNLAGSLMKKTGVLFQT